MPDAEVPRGTPRVLGLRMCEALTQAIAAGYKTETRRLMSPRNCQLTRGLFENLDWSSGRPDRLYPVSTLRCRIETGTGERRSVSLLPTIRPRDIFWVRRGQAGPQATRAGARYFLKVTQVGVGRLCDLSENEAHAEGIRVYAPSCRAAYERAGGLLDVNEEAVLAPIFAAEAYEFLLGHLGKKLLAQWRRGPVHADMVGRAPRARDAFALLWESLNGSGSWQRNPWVWRYVFEPTERPPEFEPPSAPLEAPRGWGSL